MKLTNRSNVPVYTISGSNTSRQLPDWVARKRKRSLKHDPEYANRVELLQDFEFEEASQCIRVSEDGDWVVSTGTYKPQIHVHSTAQLSLSYSHHTDALNHSFELLSSDYTKSLHLQTDRSLEFHTPSGRHYTTRVPRYGRDLKYDRRSAEVVIPAVGLGASGSGEVFRLNLELGRFMRSYAVDVGGDRTDPTGTETLQGGVSTGAVNCAAIAHESHGLLAFGTSKGTIEFFDPRQKSRVALLAPPIDPLQSILNSADALAPTEVTALQFHPSGLTVGAGSSTGLIHLYDLRSSRPLLEKDHGYGYPVQTLKFLISTSSRTSHLSAEPKVLSADKRIIKLWDARRGDPWTAVEPTVDLNCVEWVSDTGMILTANEGQQQHSFLIPALGPAPRWCSFLDNMVEEMAEDASDPNAYENTALGQGGEVYDNYKFLTQPQMDALGLSHLIGTTGMVRPYMHGFFVQQRLYEEARLVAQPEVWAEEREKKIRERIEKERESRIRGSKKLNVKVNQALADKLVERQKKHEQQKARRALRKAEQETNDRSADDVPADGDANEAKAQSDGAVLQPRPGLLSDDRFSALFKDPSYAVDETSNEFRALNASTKIQQQNKEYQRSLAKGTGLTAVEEEELEERRGPDSSSEDEESDGEEKDLQNGRPEERRDPVREQYEASLGRKKKRSKLDKKPVKKRDITMRVSSSNAQPISAAASESFGTRLSQNNGFSGTKRDAAGRKGGNVVGEKETTFVVGNKQKSRAQRDGDGDEAGTGVSRSKKGERRSASGNVFRRM
ncbi:MAG: hypothetical protein Q9162_003329 [Coniocarpon cinnabarinum]